jgi:PleD family two-component response regulator
MTESYIMAVDDTLANLALLEDILGKEGYEVRSFRLGRLALAAALKYPPDLILLDANMPEMSGYELCKRLKAAQETSHIPVIFLSGLDGFEDKARAFRAGAADYISKPFLVEEVQARVRTNIKLYRLQRVLSAAGLQI